MKLTYESANLLLEGLKALDGYSKAIKINGEDRLIVEFYKLGGAVRLNVAKNINLLRSIIEDFTTARNAMIREISGGEASIDIKKNPELAAKLWDEERVLLKTEAGDLNLIEIDVSALKLEENPIPPSAIAALSAILRE